MRISLLAMALAAAVAGLQAQPSFPNLDYVGDRNAAHLLDLYLPAGNGPFPIAVFIHGGGWSSGNKSGPFGFPVDLLPRGIALASINYRLSDEAIFPAQIQDCKAAVRFLRANAAKYKLDPARIAVMGDSAGAHLAALVATTSDVTAWDTPTMPNPAVSSKVLALVALAPPISVFDGPAEGAFANLLGCPAVAACPEKVKEASPLTYITPDDPPVLLFQGTDDPVVDPENARAFDEALVRAGCQVTYRVLPGVAHVDNPACQSPLVKGMIADFLDRMMNGTPASAAASDFEFARFGPHPYVSVFGSYLGNQQVIPGAGPLPATVGGFSVNIQDSTVWLDAAGEQQQQSRWCKTGWCKTARSSRWRRCHFRSPSEL